jgi:ADP-heptose:LPS heptosyltransferase
MSNASLKRAHRFAGRAQVVSRALLHRVSQTRRAPSEPRRILIAHQLLLGDTLMLTPLISKLRGRYPGAEIVLALPQAYEALYAKAPYGVRAIGWDPRVPAASALWTSPGYDVAYVPGDNRFSWLALALGSRWIVAFDGDRPWRKSWPVDELRPYPAIPAAWGDMVAMLADGPPPSKYAVSDWAAPEAQAFDLPAGAYAVLHVGASSKLKLWPPERWRAIATWLESHGIEPVWSAGSGEQGIARECDPHGRWRGYAGGLSLPQLWRLLEKSALLVAPDTGVAHLGRVVGTPTIALFGPGSAMISGGGAFWGDAPFRAVTIDPFPCRDQQVLFKREIAWVRRCGRTIAECPHPRCMDAIDVERVIEAIDDLGIASKG